MANPHLGVAKELLLRSRGRGGGGASWGGRAFKASRVFVCHRCGEVEQCCLDLKRVYEAPFPERAGRLPLGQAS